MDMDKDGGPGSLDAGQPGMQRPHRFSLASIRGRLVLLSLLALLPALLVAAYNGLRLRGQALDQARQELLFVVRGATGQFDALLGRGRGLLGALAQLPAVIGGDPAACRRVLMGFLEPESPYANYGVIDPRGDVVCSAVAMPAPVNVADRAYFKRAVASGRFSLGDFQIGRITGVPVLVLAQPVSATDRTLRAVVFAALRLDWLERIAREAALPGAARLALWDPGGRVLLSWPHPDAAAGGAQEPIAPRPVAGKSGTAEVVGPDGVEHLVGYVRLRDGAAGEGPLLSIAVPRHQIYAGVRTLTWRSLLGGMVVAGLLLAAAWWATERLVLQRLDHLGAAALRLARGDLQARSGIPAGKDEIAWLAGVFDGMAESLQEQVARITALNRLYALLSGINGALLRHRDRGEFLHEACRIAVERGGFRLAWVGLLAPGDAVLRPRALAGRAAAYARDLAIPVSADDPRARGPTGTALREGKTVVCNDIGSDPAMAPWRKAALGHGLRASIALPLKSGARVVGVFNLYAARPQSFDDQELRLLDEIAADIGYALEGIEKDERIRFLANHDSLTRLPNRSLFEDRLAQLVRRAPHSRRFFALLFLYVDNVREVTAVAGHHAGDALLVALADHLTGVLRQGDTVARLGGAEFGLLLADLARPEDAGLVAERVLETLPRSMAVEGEPVYLAVRGGVAVYPADGTDPPTLLKNAELALHRAREADAGGLVFFSPELDAYAREWHGLKRDLHQALARGELALHYQPVIAVASGRMIGAEALARWHQPERGFIAPSKFIRIAEESGLTVPLGEWVFESAARQAEDWAGTYGGDAPTVSINVSARQLHAPDFLPRIRERLQAPGAGGLQGRLAIEITETELMQDLDAVTPVLGSLRDLGLRIDIDDFGTGYSSLNYLRRLPVDALKIDKSFVDDVTDDPDAQFMVKGIIALARGLGLRTIAEGVETRAQLDRLAFLGCDAVQGYLFSRPRPADEIAGHIGQVVPPAGA